jgi:hypothetical protein
MPHPWHFPAGRTNLAGPEGRKRVQAGQVVRRREAFYTERDVDSVDPVAMPPIGTTLIVRMAASCARDAHGVAHDAEAANVAQRSARGGLAVAVRGHRAWWSANGEDTCQRLAVSSCRDVTVACVAQSFEGGHGPISVSSRSIEQRWGVFRQEKQSGVFPSREK